MGVPKQQKRQKGPQPVLDCTATKKGEEKKGKPGGAVPDENKRGSRQVVPGLEPHFDFELLSGLQHGGDGLFVGRHPQAVLHVPDVIQHRAGRAGLPHNNTS